ncbi:MAG: SAM-dependent chlorinase/fluorinase [Gemmatimonadetes bacterium]|nr:SAM-dependent chlorinase/fluorinase [Gemmatimonadota bacterium]
MATPGIVTLLTDFGTADGFVAAMKGVILSIAPQARVIDAVHDIAPGDVEAAAWVLDQYFFLYPEGTVHVAVVDPGVGTERRALAARLEGRYLVAPDNGIGTRVFRRAARLECVSIENPTFMRPEISRTFHGRDIFAPAAAHLASGVPLGELGPVLPDPVRLDLPEPRRIEGEDGGPVRLEGHVVHVDRFGNLITDIPAAWLESHSWVVSLEKAGGASSVQQVPLRRTYGEVARGELVAVIGSMGTLEVAVREGSAAAALAVGRRARVLCEVAVSPG